MHDPYKPGIDGSEEGGGAFEEMASTRGIEILIACGDGVDAMLSSPLGAARSAGALQPGQRSHVVFMGAWQLQQ